jgi:hypothetical protein
LQFFKEESHSTRERLKDRILTALFGHKKMAMPTVFGSIEGKTTLQLQVKDRPGRA